MSDTATAKSRSAGLLNRAEVAAATLPPLLVEAERVATTVHQGVHGRRRVGQGETFWQFRRFQEGDSGSQIDWRRSAKSDHLFVREMEWEAAQSVWLWRDPSSSMDYRHGRDLPSKQDRASLLALALASLLIRSGERVAMLGSGIRPGSARVTLQRLAEFLTVAGMSGDHAADSLPPAENLPLHAHLALFSDFFAPLPEIQSRIHRFAERGMSGVLVQVLDPSEETLPFSGRVLFEGPENEGELLVSRVEALREGYHGRMQDHRQGLRDIARSVGWTLLTHHTDQPPQAALMALYSVLSRSEV